MTFTPEDYRREARDLREGIASCCLWLPTSPCASCVSDDRLAIMLDAAAEMVQPKTCATCRHWCAGKHQGEEMRESYIRNLWTAECGLKSRFREMFSVYIYGDGRVDDYDFDTPQDFGCTLWTPR